jgi:hypothetical protein
MHIRDLDKVDETSGEQRNGNGPCNGHRGGAIRPNDGPGTMPRTHTLHAVNLYKVSSHESPSHIGPPPHGLKFPVCQEGTAASRLPKWRSQIKGSTVRTMDGHPINSRHGFIIMVTNLRRQKVRKVKIVVAKHAITAVPNADIPPATL